MMAAETLGLPIERVRAIIEAHRLNRDGAEIARNFMFRGRIRKIYVTPEQQALILKHQA